MAAMLLGAQYRPASLVCADDEKLQKIRTAQTSAESRIIHDGLDLKLRTPFRPLLRKDRVPLRIDEQTCSRSKMLEGLCGSGKNSSEVQQQSSLLSFVHYQMFNF